LKPIDDVWLVLAGFGGGLTGTVAGLASLVSYPALLAVGLPPVAANVTNTVALVFDSVGAVRGSRRELAGQAPRARPLAAIAVAGGITGGILLLLTPAGSFADVVPVLIGLAALAVLLPRRVPSAATGTSEPPPARPAVAVGAAVYCIGIYGGYFGAAAGVMLLALLLFTTGEPFARANALKNLLLGLANAVAAVSFAVFGPVRWTVVVPLAAGFLVGGRLGPIVVRRVPAGPLRLLVAAAGLGLAVHLGLNAY
jgi:uncharacterized membrane protein YfcA